MILIKLSKILQVGCILGITIGLWTAMTDNIVMGIALATMCIIVFITRPYIQVPKGQSPKGLKR